MKSSIQSKVYNTSKKRSKVFHLNHGSKTKCVMKIQKYVKQNHILAHFSCFVNLHECHRQKPEQRGLQVA